MNDLKQVSEEELKNKLEEEYVIVPDREDEYLFTQKEYYYNINTYTGRKCKK